MIRSAILSECSHKIYPALYFTGQKILWNIHTLQELMRYNNVKTTMINKHMVNRSELGMKSPFDNVVQFSSAISALRLLAISSKIIIR